MVQYDPKIINEFADRLYRKANTVIAFYTIGGMVIGAFAGYLVGRDIGLIGSDIGFFLLGAILVGGAGYYAGREKTLELKFRAQTALCQVKIEENTRK